MDYSSTIQLVFAALVSGSVAWIFKREQKMNDDINSLREKVVSIEKDTDKNRELLEQKIGHIEQSIIRMEALLNQILNR